MIAGFRSHLRAAGVDVAHEIGRGALVLSFDQSHLENGQFHVDRMLALLKDELAAALRGGYSGLWATGDMKWELGNERNFDKLLEYECRLEEFLRKNPTMSGVCQYHRDMVPAIALEVARSTHGFINETLRRLYPVAQALHTGGAGSARVQNLLDGLNRRDAPLE
jgi:hypothetical protein